MKKFSERIGASKVPKVIQMEGLSIPLRNSIWNFTVSLFSDRESGWWSPAEFFAQFFFKSPVDELPPYDIARRDWIKKRLYEMKWFEVYDFIEFLCIHFERLREYSSWDKTKLHVVFNRIFEEEMSGYRFIGGELVPVSSPAEVSERVYDLRCARQWVGEEKEIRQRHQPREVRRDRAAATQRASAHQARNGGPLRSVLRSAVRVAYGLPVAISAQ